LRDLALASSSAAPTSSRKSARASVENAISKLREVVNDVDVAREKLLA
jgi:hypothetical protein